jgi:hypothetical protein
LLGRFEFIQTFESASARRDFDQFAHAQALTRTRLPTG